MRTAPQVVRRQVNAPIIQTWFARVVHAHVFIHNIGIVFFIFFKF
jgi:hypothetical protein